MGQNPAQGLTLGEGVLADRVPARREVHTCSAAISPGRAFGPGQGASPTRPYPGLITQVSRIVLTASWKKGL